MLNIPLPCASEQKLLLILIIGYVLTWQRVQFQGPPLLDTLPSLHLFDLYLCFLSFWLGLRFLHSLLIPYKLS